MNEPMEYLVRHRGRWHIARAGVVKAPHFDAPEEMVNQLCWCDRAGAVICFAREEDDVQELPE